MRETGPDRVPPTRGELFGSLVIGDIQPTDAPNSQTRLYTADLRTGAFTSWPAGLRDDEGIDQIVASIDGRRALVSITAVTGPRAGHNRIEIFDLRSHHDVGRLALPGATAQFVDGLNAAISPDAGRAYSSLGRDRIGVFALPSGRYLHSLTVRYANPDSDRIEVIPWQFDPAGRLVLGGFDRGPSGSEPSAKSGPSLPPNQRLGLLDISTGRLVAQLGLGDILAPSVLAWSHDARLLAVGTYDGTLALYDASTFTLRANAGPVESGRVTTASFGPDDRTLVTGGTAGAMSFWSVPDLAREGQPIPIGNAANNGGILPWYSASGDVVGLAQDERRNDTSLQRWFTFPATPTRTGQHRLRARRIRHHPSAMAALPRRPTIPPHLPSTALVTGSLASRLPALDELPVRSTREHVLAAAIGVPDPLTSRVPVRVRSNAPCVTSGDHAAPHSSARLLLTWCWFARRHFVKKMSPFPAASSSYPIFGHRDSSPSAGRGGRRRASTASGQTRRRSSPPTGHSGPAIRTHLRAFGRWPGRTDRRIQRACASPNGQRRRDAGSGESGRVRQVLPQV